MSGRRIHVVAGVLSDAAGRVLVAQRPSGAHLEGLWEFPGGKLKPGESRETGLVRELDEELGVRVLAACPLVWVEHRYPDRHVVLDVWSVESYSGEPHGREGQPVEWRDVRSLDSVDFPPADAPVLAALRLPRRYLVTPEPGRDWTPFLDRLADRISRGFDLVQLRAKSLEEPALVELGRRAAEICRRSGARLLINTEPEIARRCGADGVHLSSRRLAGMVRERYAVPGDSGVAPEGMSDAPLDPESAGNHALSSPERLPASFVHGRPVHGDKAPSALRPDAACQSPSTASSARKPQPAGALAPATNQEFRSGDGGLDDRGVPAVLASATGQGSRGNVPDGRPFLIGASIHDRDDLERARAVDSDFAVLGPVRVTPTHPDAPTLQWDGFMRLARGAGMPVFAIGGLGDDDITAALRSGGQGVAAIRAFWGEE